VKIPKINPKVAVRHLGRNIQTNSPTILSVVAVAGVAATGYFAVKAGMESAKKIEDDRYKESIRSDRVTPPKERTAQEKALLVWKLYIPAVVTGTATIGCIVASNRIQARRMAAMLAAYGVLSGDFDEYKEKAQELLGQKKTTELREHMGERKQTNYPVPANGVLVPEGKSWFLDARRGVYLLTNREFIDGTVNEMNFSILNHGEASLNEFYTQLGMDPVGYGNYLGWNQKHKCAVKYTPIISEDRGAVTVFEFQNGPRPDFFKGEPPIDVTDLEILER
jgi:hypothetical protein